MALKPAVLRFNSDGAPCSASYGSAYFSTIPGPERATQVFLAACQLPHRWQACQRFVVLDTCFGCGLNFLTTWAAWQADTQRCARLHYISTEKHPLTRDELSQLHRRWPELTEFSNELRSQWPTLTPGFHRLELAGGRVILTLCFGDPAEQLAQLDASVNAIYLDGIAAVATPEIWSQAMFSQLARLAADGASLASWSLNGEVQRGLKQAGFDCKQYAEPVHGQPSLQCTIRKASEPNKVQAHSRKAIIFGAGLAGASIAERLAARNWQVTVIESLPGPGMGASGNHAGVLRPLPSLDDNRLARLTRAGSLHASRLHQRMLDSGLSIRFGRCGVLHIARDPKHETRQHQVIARHAYPEDFAMFVDQRAASNIAGWPVAMGGWWFPGGGWVQPHSLCSAALAAHPGHITTLYHTTVAALERRNNAWHALDEQGRSIAEAPVAILANGVQMRNFKLAADLPIRPARGQVAHLPARAEALPRTVVCRLGYVSPPVDNTLCAGASFAVDDDDPTWRDSDHAENLAKLDFILPGFADSLPAGQADGRVGFRPASPDRLPMVGALPVAGHVPTGGDTLADVPREQGLYAVGGFGARGLVWSAIVAELLASELEGEALPLERDLKDAIDPARFLLRPRRTSLSREDG